MQPNREQLLAASHRTGVCLVLAGPGSGKTSTLISRISYLVSDCRISPEEILMLTFSRASAEEMRLRCEKRLGGDLASGIFFGTFHSFFFHILRRFGGFFAGDIVKDFDRTHFFPEGDGKGNTRLYEEWKRDAHKLDYQDMEKFCRALLREREDVRTRFAGKFKYVMVDEFQDISGIQYEILKLIFAGEGKLGENADPNLFFVGDDDQSIYGFRGAKPGIMLKLREDFPDMRIIRFSVNYRCPERIVEASGRLISHNRTRYEKNIRSAPENGSGKISVITSENSVKECAGLAGLIRELMDAGTKPSDIAVLGRVRGDLRRMGDTCMEYQIPYVFPESGQSIYGHFIFLDLFAYLMLAEGSRERRYMLRVLNRPERYLSPACAEDKAVSFGRMISWYGFQEAPVTEIEKFRRDMREMSFMAPYAAICYVCKKIGYLGYLESYAREKGIEKKALFAVLGEVLERAKPFASAGEWKEQIEGVQRAQETGNVRERQSQSQKNRAGREGVQLMTMHGAKGLEFPYVCILGVNEQNMPSPRAMLPEEIEEERRLFYVAATRAKKELILSFSEKRNGKDGKPSRFLKELLPAYQSPSSSYSDSK